jgi:UDP-glucose 4-epimerase
MVLPRFVKQALTNEPITVYGDGMQSRTFCYIDDVIDAMTRLMDFEGAMGEIFNVGTQEEISIMDLAKKVRGILDSSSDIVTIPYEKAYIEGFEDMQRRMPDISKIKNSIHWEPTTDLDTIIVNVADWIRETGRD